MAKDIYNPEPDVENFTSPSLMRAARSAGGASLPSINKPNPSMPTPDMSLSVMRSAPLIGIKQVGQAVGRGVGAFAGHVVRGAKILYDPQSVFDAENSGASPSASRMPAVQPSNGGVVAPLTGPFDMSKFSGPTLGFSGIPQGPAQSVADIAKSARGVSPSVASSALPRGINNATTGGIRPSTPEEDARNAKAYNDFMAHGSTPMTADEFRAKHFTGGGVNPASAMDAPQLRPSGQERLINAQNQGQMDLQKLILDRTMEQLKAGIAPEQIKHNIQREILQSQERVAGIKAAGYVQGQREKAAGMSGKLQSYQARSHIRALSDKYSTDMRSIDKQMQSAYTPEERAALTKRQNAVHDEYMKTLTTLSGGAPAVAAASSNGEIPDESISLLKSNPEMRDAFDEKYGEGASDDYLEG